MINTPEVIKKYILKLYKENPKIHVNVSITKPRIHLENVACEIKEVYPNLFIVEDLESDTKKRYTLNYIDVFTKQVEILELTKIKIKF